MNAYTSPIGTVQFMGMDLDVPANVLMPRAETELLAREAQALLADLGKAPLCIDMCCGVANLAVALATTHAGATVWASDLTDDAVRAARRNADKHGLAGRVHVVQGDLFAPLAVENLQGRVDLIVANPPYISTRRLVDGDRAHLLAGEPREAFDGGPYGIALHQRIIAEAPAFLKPGGWLGFEFGEGQNRQIAALIKRARIYGEPRWHRNEADADRVVFIQKRADLA
jgi:release factor glutamine methyltransferase